MQSENLGTFTEFGKLKKVIVGRELQYPERVMDITFKAFYRDNIKNNQFTNYKDYSINSQLIQERNEDLDQLSKILEDHGAIVYRPKMVDRPITVQTPHFKSLLSSASNVRDLTLTYGALILETPPLIRGRYFENSNLYQVFKQLMVENEYAWLKAPSPLMDDTSFDDEDWSLDRDFKQINHAKWDLGIDAAQYIKIGKDLFCNISTYNHYLGMKWVDKVIQMKFPDAKIHLIEKMVDNHLDGCILPLAPGVFLVNDSALAGSIDNYLPEKFKSWKKIRGNKDYKHAQKDYNTYNTPFVQLSSYRGMDINVLSIDEKTVLVNDDAKYVQDELDKNGFNVVPVRLRHCELFGGGIHCSTLDVEREDGFFDYTK